MILFAPPAEGQFSIWAGIMLPYVDFGLSPLMELPDLELTSPQSSVTLLASPAHQWMNVCTIAATPYDKLLIFRSQVNRLLPVVLPARRPVEAHPRCSTLEEECVYYRCFALLHYWSFRSLGWAAHSAI